MSASESCTHILVATTAEQTEEEEEEEALCTTALPPSSAIRDAHTHIHPPTTIVWRVFEATPSTVPPGSPVYSLLW